jgi:hypothetical protein
MGSKETIYQSKHRDTLRWASLLKQKSAVTVYRLPTKDNKLPFSVSVAANKRKFAVSIFR